MTGQNTQSGSGSVGSSSQYSKQISDWFSQLPSQQARQEAAQFFLSSLPSDQAEQVTTNYYRSSPDACQSVLPQLQRIAEQQQQRS